jgi:hypothetical protein
MFSERRSLSLGIVLITQFFSLSSVSRIKPRQNIWTYGYTKCVIYFSFQDILFLLFFIQLYYFSFWKINDIHLKTPCIRSDSSRCHKCIISHGWFSSSAKSRVTRLAGSGRGVQLHDSPAARLAGCRRFRGRRAEPLPAGGCPLPDTSQRQPPLSLVTYEPPACSESVPKMADML